MQNFFMLMVFYESYPFSSNFQNGEIICSAFIAKQILRKCTAWRTWTSLHVYLNFTLFFTCFFLIALHPLLVTLHPLIGIEQVIYQWKAAETRNFPVLIIFSYSRRFLKFFIWYSFSVVDELPVVFTLKFGDVFFICNFLIHSSSFTQMVFLLYKPLSQFF